MTNITNDKYTVKDIKKLFPSIDYDEGIGSCPYCGITGSSLGISKTDIPLKKDVAEIFKGYSFEFKPLFAKFGDHLLNM